MSRWKVSKKKKKKKKKKNGTSKDVFIFHTYLRKIPILTITFLTGQRTTTVTPVHSASLR